MNDILNREGSTTLEHKLIAATARPTNVSHKSWLFGACKHICLLLLLLVIIYPFLTMILSSLKTQFEILRNPLHFFPTHFSFEAYVGIWDRLPFLLFYKNTVIFAGSVMILSVFFDCLSGYAFARMRFKGRKILFLIVLSTMMVPFQVIMIPFFIQMSKMGLIDSYIGLILPRATSAFGIFMMRQFFLTLPQELEEAARIDGCTEFRIFRTIMLPLCKPAIISLGIILLMNNWNDLLYPMLLTNSNEMRPIQAGIALMMGRYAIEYNYVLAGSFLALLPILVIYIFAQRFFIQGIAMSGLKG